MKKILLSLAILLNSSYALSQSYTNIQLGLDKSVSPYTFATNLNGSWKQLGTLSSDGYLTMIFRGDANWTTGTNTTRFSTIVGSVNSPLPANAKFGYNAGSIVEGISFSQEVPSPSNVLHASAISGYTRSRGTTAGVGVYGGCIQSESNTRGCWGINTAVSNSPYTQPSLGTLNGYNFGFNGNEFDINLMKKPDGTAPSGNVAGLYLVGASETLSSGLNAGILIDQMGISKNIKWQYGILFADGSVTQGIRHGATAKPPTNDVGSIPDYYVSRDSGGVSRVSTINADANGNLVLTAASGKSVSVPGNISVTTGTVNSYLDLIGNRIYLNASRTAYIQADASGNIIIHADTGKLVSLQGGASTNGPFYLSGYTVATLPVCATAGQMAYATDLTTLSYNALAVGGGAYVAPVFCNGIQWKVH